MKKFIIAWSSSFLNEIKSLKSDLEQRWYEVINYTQELWDRDYQEVYNKFFKDNLHPRNINPIKNNPQVIIVINNSVEIKLIFA